SSLVFILKSSRCCVGSPPPALGALPPAKGQASRTPSTPTPRGRRSTSLSFSGVPVHSTQCLSRPFLYPLVAALVRQLCGTLTSLSTSICDYPVTIKKTMVSATATSAAVLAHKIG